MKKIFNLLPFLVLALMSCEQNANIDLPETPPKLVISCYLMPQDSVIRAMISKSNPVFNSASTNTGAPLTDATVTLYGNSSSVQLVYNAFTSFYEAPTSTFPIIAGNEYHIIVTEPSGMHADAFTTVPANAPAGFQCTATDSVYSSDPFYTSGETRFEYSFSDPSGVNNFYRFVTYNVFVQQWSNDTVLERSGWDIFSDENADGTVITNHSLMGFYINGDSLVGYDVWMLNCNYDYYMFHQSIYNYSGGDPFSEPTLVYSNVTDGLGIFAAANCSRIRIPR